MRRLMLLAQACGLTLLFAVPAQAQLNGNHTLGDFGVQSGSQPQPGFYAALFYLRYDTDTIKDADGETVRLPQASPAPGSLAVSAVAPMVWYVSKTKLFGANYGAMVVFPFANASHRSAGCPARQHRGHELFGHADPPARSRLAHGALGRRGRASAVHAHRPVRTRRQRQHRQGHVGVRTVRRRHVLLRRKAERQFRDDGLLGAPREEKGHRRQGRPAC